MMQTGAMPFAPRSAGGTLGTFVNKLPDTEFSRAHATAQKNAALPVEQGGLGLHKDNTAMDRARALGFDTDAYHGTRADTQTLKAIRPNSGTSAIMRSTGLKPVFTTDSPMQASEYALRRNKGKGSSVYPLLINRNNEVGYHFPSDSYLKNKHILYDEDYSRGLGGSSWMDTMPLYHWAADTKAPTVRMEGVHDGAGISNNFPSTVTAIIDPKNIRSKFAAFDPLKKDSANILASILAGTTLASAMGDKKRTKK
jgi:hypothetical protein